MSTGPRRRSVTIAGMLGLASWVVFLPTSIRAGEGQGTTPIQTPITGAEDSWRPKPATTSSGAILPCVQHARSENDR